MERDFLCSKLKVRFEISRTTPGFCSISVHVVAVLSFMLM